MALDMVGVETSPLPDLLFTTGNLDEVLSLSLCRGGESREEEFGDNLTW